MVEKIFIIEMYDISADNEGNIEWVNDNPLYFCKTEDEAKNVCDLLNRELTNSGKRFKKIESEDIYYPFFKYSELREYSTNVKIK